MNFIKIIKNNPLSLLRFFCHSRKNGNPESANNNLDSRLRGNDRRNYLTKNLKPKTYNLKPSPHNLPPTTYHLQPSSGFTLIETLVAISILMIAVASPLTIAQKGLASAIYAKDQIIASYLAQDAIEYIINVSGQNVADGNGWLNVIKDKCASAMCSISTDENDFTSPAQIAIVDCGGSCPVLKYNISSHKYNYNYTGSGDSPFTRSVTVTETVPGVEALITVTMSWKDKGTTRTLVFYTRIYNWR